MRIYKLVFPLLVLILLAGCVQMDIELGVDESYSAYITYHLHLDLSEMDGPEKISAGEGVEELLSYYETMRGVSVTPPKSLDDTDEYDFSISKSISCDSYEEAFAELRKMLTDVTVTPFIEVDMTCETTEQQQLYHIQATTDFSNVLASSNLPEFPPSLQKKIQEAFAACTGSVSVHLPGTEIENASGEAKLTEYQVSMQTPFDFNSQTPFELTTRLNLYDGMASEKTIAEILQEFQRTKYIGIGVAAAGFLIVIAGVLLFVNARKNARAKTTTPEGQQPR